MPCWSEGDDDDPSEAWKKGVNAADLGSFSGDDDQAEAWKDEVDLDDLASNVSWESHDLAQFSRGRWYSLNGSGKIDAIPANFKSYLSLKILSEDTELLTFTRARCMGRLDKFPDFPKSQIHPFADPDDLLVFVGIPEEHEYATRALFFAFVVHYEEVGEMISHS